jgi:hypothetical protein
MAEITRTAQFGPADALARMLDDISCSVCGYREPADTYRLSVGNNVRYFCDGCGAFVTISLNPQQAERVRGWSLTGPLRG